MLIHWQEGLFQIITSCKLKGPTARVLVRKQTALRTEHDSIVKIEEIEKIAEKGQYGSKQVLHTPR